MKNLSKSQPLPVKFEAVRALEAFLFVDSALEFVKTDLNTLIKRYIRFMNEFDNEGLVGIFQKLIDIFSDDIKIYALEITKHLAQ